MTNHPRSPRHDRRERRVQELERAVKIASCQLAQGSNMDFSDANIERWQEEAQRIEQQLLIEAREALAKHPISPQISDSASGDKSSKAATETRDWGSNPPQSLDDAFVYAEHLADHACKQVRMRFPDADISYERREKSVVVIWDGEVTNEIEVEHNG